MAMTPDKKLKRRERQQMMARLVDQQVVQQAEAMTHVLEKYKIAPSEKAIRRMSKEQLGYEEKRLKGILLDRNVLRVSKRQMRANAKVRVKQVLQQSKDQAVQDREIEQQGEELALQQISQGLPSLPTDTASDG